MKSKLPVIKTLLIISAITLVGFNFSNANRAWVYLKDTFTHQKSAWPHLDSDLQVDSRIHFGQLQNGLRYAILPNSEPPGRISMRLLIRSGSFMEDDNQRGIAHFLEHMAFNGTRSFSEGELVEYFQRLGMAFGAHTNAHTGLDETVYKLELPNNTPSTLEKALQVFRDFTDGMLLKESAIDSERGVVYSELRDGLSPEWNILQEELKFYFQGTRIPVRLPIGLDTVILNAPKERFDAFYKDWYTPDRMTLVLVGDIDPKAVEDLINVHFNDMPASKHNGFPDLGKVQFTQPRAKVHIEPEASSTEINIGIVKNISPERDSRDLRKLDIQRSIPYSILNQRLDILQRTHDSPFYSSSASKSNWFDYFEIHFVGLTCKADKWEPALQAAEREIRRALEFGFTDTELKEAKHRIINDYEQAARNAPTTKNRTHSESIVNHLSSDEVYITPEYELELAKEALDAFTKEQAHEFFQETWNNHHPQIFISGNKELIANDNQALRVYLESTQTTVTPPKNEVIPYFAYQSFGKSTKIIKESIDKDLNILQYHFENNVRLNLMPTSYQKGDISVLVNFGDGEKSLKESEIGLNSVASSVFIDGGLEAHSITEIERIHADATVSVAFGVDGSSFVLSGNTTPKDLQKQLNLITAFLNAPGYRQEALLLAHKKFEDFYRKLHTTPQSVYSDQVDRYLANNHALFGIPKKNKVMGFNLNHVQEWLHQPLKEGYLEVTIVGDFDPRDALQSVAQTLGALPKRQLNKNLDLLQGAQFPKSPKKTTFQVKSTLPKALASVVWPTNDFWDIIRSRKLSLLGEIYSDRLRKEIREKLGDAYSPYAYHHPSRLFKGYGRFIAVANVSPEQTEKVVEIMKNIGKNLASGNITQDEFDRAQKPLLVQIKQQERQNAYWLSQIAQIQTYPQMLDWAKNRHNHYKSFSLQDMKAMAKKYLDADNAYQVIIIPNDDPSSQELSTSS